MKTLSKSLIRPLKFYKVLPEKEKHKVAVSSHVKRTEYSIKSQIFSSLVTFTKFDFLLWAHSTQKNSFLFSTINAIIR